MKPSELFLTWIMPGIAENEADIPLVAFLPRMSDKWRKENGRIKNYYTKLIEE
ncbi:MAG: hypothetical protein PUC88_00855 [Clostridia bacterium]|nr:hypothetical protein [Clostridia bacterium]